MKLSGMHDATLDCKSAMMQGPVLCPGSHVGDISLFGAMRENRENLPTVQCIAGSQWNQHETTCLVLSCDTIRRAIAVDVFKFFQVIELLNTSQFEHAD